MKMVYFSQVLVTEFHTTYVHAFNIVYGNRQAPSRDIGRAFTTLFVLQTVASSESNDAEK